MASQTPRRPIATRDRGWAKALAATLDAANVSPNAISIAGVALSAAAGYLLWSSGTAAGAARVAELLGSAALIQLRLLCNMLDGMVAIEGNRQTRAGELFNGMPDRFADALILVGAGYSLEAFAWGPALGWTAALLAILTAYVRLLGGSMGARQYFIGPMAKPQRMAALTVACVLSTLEPLAGWHGQTIATALALIVLGSIVTVVRRTSAIVAELHSR